MWLFVCECGGVCVCVCLSVYLSIYLSGNMSVFNHTQNVPAANCNTLHCSKLQHTATHTISLSICRLVRRSNYLSVILYICQSVYVSICLSIHLSVSQSVYLGGCVCVYAFLFIYKYILSVSGVCVYVSGVYVYVCAKVWVVCGEVGVNVRVPKMYIHAHTR